MSKFRDIVIAPVGIQSTGGETAEIVVQYIIVISMNPHTSDAGFTGCVDEKIVIHRNAVGMPDNKHTAAVNKSVSSDTRYVAFDRDNFQNRC